MEWGTRPIPRWIGGRGTARRGTKPERAEPAVRSSQEECAVGARRRVARENEGSDLSHHHVSTTRRVGLLPRPRASIIVARIIGAHTIGAHTIAAPPATSGAPTPGLTAGVEHQGTSVGRSVMQE